MRENVKNRLNDDHEAILEIIEENAYPVATSDDIRESDKVDISKPTRLKRLDDLERWGLIERMTVGSAYAMWPTGKYSEMEAHIDDLEKDVEYYQRHAEKLEEELEDARARAKEAEEELDRLQSGPAPVSSSRPFVPERHAEIGEETDRLWRVRLAAWGRSFLRYAAIAGIALTLGFFFAVLGPDIRAIFDSIGLPPADTLQLILAFLAFVWIGGAVAAVGSFGGIVLSLLAVRYPQVATRGERVVDAYHFVIPWSTRQIEP